MTTRHEWILDLLPEPRLKRRIAEQAAARFSIGLLVAIPVGVIAAAVLLLTVAHAVAVRICGAGLLVGSQIRAGVVTGASAVLGLRHA